MGILEVWLLLVEDVGVVVVVECEYFVFGGVFEYGVEIVDVGG